MYARSVVAVTSVALAAWRQRSVIGDSTMAGSAGSAAVVAAAARLWQQADGGGGGCCGHAHLHCAADALPPAIAAAAVAVTTMPASIVCRQAAVTKLPPSS